MKRVRRGAKAGKLTVLVANNNGELLGRTHSRNIHLMNDETYLETDQNERLSELVRLDAFATGLREKVVELEVDYITAQTALEHTELTRVQDVDVKVAAAIVLSIERRGELSNAQVEHQSTDASRIGQLQLGLSALLDWVSAAQSNKSQGHSRVVKGVFALVVLVVLCAGLAVHWALLILLLPIGAARAMMWSGNDVNWQRVGARRRYEQSGLAPPRDWTMTAVRTRMQALEEELGDLTEQKPLSGGSSSNQRLNANDNETLADVEKSLLDLLGSVGLTENTLDVDMTRELRLFSRPLIVKRELAELRSNLAQARREADIIRNDLYRFLRRHGVGPAEGQADIASLTEALKRLSESP